MCIPWRRLRRLVRHRALAASLQESAVRLYDCLLQGDYSKEAAPLVAAATTALETASALLPMRSSSEMRV